MEHVRSFGEYSRYKIWSVNTELGFPNGLLNLQFAVVVLHYSVFYGLSARFREYLSRRPGGFVIAFFQDEHHNCAARFDLINDLRVRCIYTLLEVEEAEKVYGRFTSAREFRRTLTGYVGAQLMSAARRLTKPESVRRIDVGYRARAQPFYAGRGAQEKRNIALEFLAHATATGLTLVLDIDPEERSRIYGDDWYRFVADCRGVLGVEAGTSIFDLDGSVKVGVEKLLQKSPAMSFDEMEECFLRRFEDRIPYRTISPRVFEAAAFRVTQILFEGMYQGILVPMVHYIPLKKNFSNFEDVVRLFQDPAVRQQLTDNAYRDLIESGQYSYARFAAEFDEHLNGAVPELASRTAHFPRVDRLLERGALRRSVVARLVALYQRGFPGKALARRILRPVLVRRQRRQNPLGVR